MGKGKGKEVNLPLLITALAPMEQTDLVTWSEDSVKLTRHFARSTTFLI
jgi:hypothetical protein